MTPFNRTFTEGAVAALIGISAVGFVESSAIENDAATAISLAIVLAALAVVLRRVFR